MRKIVARRQSADCPPSTGWFKSSFSANNSSCVEVRFDADVVMIRDTKRRGVGPIITVTGAQWADFLSRLS